MSRGPRRRLPVAVAVAAFLGLACLALAPAADATQAPATPTATIDHAQPTATGVQLLVSVPPGAGQLDLSKVSVTVGGQSVPAQAVAASTSTAISRVSILAIDTSASMRGSRIAEAKKAATAYLASTPANVKIGVLTFDDRVRLLVPPTLDRAAARAAVAGLTLTQNTSLYDGVLGAISATGPHTSQATGRRVLVLSDGKDTTRTQLPSVLAAIARSGVVVDAVAVQQSDAESQPLREIASAGKGTLINAAQPSAISAAFTQEAATLARQVVVTATVPSGVAPSANVVVDVPTGTSTVSASAYVPVHTQVKAVAKVVNTRPLPVQASGFALPRSAVFGGVGAIAIGLLGVIAALAMGPAPASADDRVAAQMRAYGMYADTDGAAGTAPDQMSLAAQARLAAEKALANNRGLEARVAARLEAAGIALKPAEWLLIRAGIAVAAGLVGALVSSGNILLGLICVIAGIVGPAVYLRLKRTARLKAFSSSLADTLQLMSGSLSAGLSLAQSIDTIVREGKEPITSEFKRVVIESRLGVPLEDAMEGVAQRMESRDWEWVVMAIRIQREVGGNLAELLLNVAATLRDREYLRRHVRALSAEGRLSCYILGGLPPGFLLYLAVSKPTYVHPLFSTAIGWILCVAMAVLLAVGVFWMSKVAKVDV